MNRFSKFEGGRYDGMTVQNLLDSGRVDYLGYCYFCLSAISFTEDILEELAITPITKPGTDPEAKKKWARQYSMENFTKEERMHGRMIHFRHLKKRRQERLEKAVAETTFTPGQLQAINHGHLKIK